MNFTLLLISIVIFFCIFLNKITNKMGIPVLVAFIALGMLFGSDGILKIPFDNYDFAEKICGTALIFIMFYGGFGTNWREAKCVAAKSLLLSTLGVLMTAGITGLFCHYVLLIDWQESFLIGALLGSTDAASVFSILRSKRLNLKYHTASLLEVESGSNDPFAYMLTAIMISFMNNTASVGSVMTMVFSQIIFGAGVGLVIALAAVAVLRRVRFSAAGFDTVFVVAVAIFSYALPTLIGGNGYLSTYLVGIVLGNADIQNKKTLVPFFDGINGLMQMAIFFLLGLLAFPTKMPSVIVPSISIAVFITLVARPIAVFSLLGPFKSRLSQMLLVSWSGLRGAASIVFAIIATMSANVDNDIYHIVFCVVLFSILIQGALLPLAARKLNMIDNNADVMKTFTDYSDEVPINFIRFRIKTSHIWCGQKIKNIVLPPDTILVLLMRGDQKIIPNGETCLCDGDALVLCAKSSGKIEGVRLSEKYVSDNQKYVGKKLSEISNQKKYLIIMISRGEKVIIPNGNTIIQKNDVLVINHQN